MESSADDEFLQCEDTDTAFNQESIVECLLGLLLVSEKTPVSSELDLCLSELFHEKQAEPQPKLEPLKELKVESKETQTEATVQTRITADPPPIKITEEGEIDESLVLLFGEEEDEEEASADLAPPARASPTSSVGLMFSWVAQSLGSILSAPHPTPSLAVLRPGTPIGAEATLLPILQGNLVRSRVVL